MSIFSSSDSTDKSSTTDPRPAGQRARAEQAHLDPNDPAKDAEAGTPKYGDFGKSDEAEPTTPTADGASGNDGSNDNPDEFSEFRKPSERNVMEYTNKAGEFDPEQQVGHVTQNQDPETIRAAQHADADVERAAFAADDPRYAGGKAQASWEEENDKEHDKN